jgi:protein-L-isoaspartate(D-aspartate) O-methyltransferase
MPGSSELDRFSIERQQMVEVQLRQRGIADVRVLAAMEKVPRHEFVTEEYRSQAYEDHPIPIGENQTISQPYIVAFMMEVLRLESFHKVLEIGTGSGYLTALLAELCGHVYSIERHQTLAESAEATLGRLGYSNVTVIVGDGSLGAPQFAPFDGIIVSAAAPQAPPSLIQQLAEGGRMIVPVGPSVSQELQLVEKLQEGRERVTQLEGCRFVPLVGGQGYPWQW